VNNIQPPNPAENSVEKPTEKPAATPTQTSGVSATASASATVVAVVAGARILVGQAETAYHSIRNAQHNTDGGISLKSPKSKQSKWTSYNI
jgi:hypothetical protein